MKRIDVSGYLQCYDYLAIADAEGNDCFCILGVYAEEYRKRHPKDVVWVRTEGLHKDEPRTYTLHHMHEYVGEVTLRDDFLATLGLGLERMITHSEDISGETELQYITIGDYLSSLNDAGFSLEECEQERQRLVQTAMT